MLSAQRLDLALSEEDLNRLAEEFLQRPGLDDLRLQLQEGVLHAGLKVSGMGFNMPVQAEVRLLEVGAGRLRLGLDITNLGLMPAIMKEVALKKVLDSLPVLGVSYHQGEVRVDLEELLGGTPVQLEVAGIEVHSGLLRLSLTNLRYLPVVSPEGDSMALQAPGPAALPSVPPQPGGGGDEPAVPAGPDSPVVAVPEHQDFYDRLKAQVGEQAHRRLPARLRPLVPWLLLVPDSFALLVRLLRDPRVPRRSKWITALAVAYFVDPLDLIPDAVPVLGQMDDLAVALFALDALLGDTPADVVQELWPGRGDIIATVRQGVRFFSRYLSGGAIARIRGFLSRRDPGGPKPDADSDPS